MEHPGEVTKLWRERKKWSIQKLASHSKIDKGTISRFENGGDYRQRVLREICRALHREIREVYLILSEGAEPSNEADPAGVLCSDNKHRKLQEMLGQILESKTEWARLISGNVISLHSSCFNVKPDLSLVVGGEPQNLSGSSKPGIVVLPDTKK